MDRKRGKVKILFLVAFVCLVFLGRWLIVMQGSSVEASSRMKVIDRLEINKYTTVYQIQVEHMGKICYVVESYAVRGAFIPNDFSTYMVCP